VDLTWHFSILKPGMIDRVSVPCIWF